MELDERCRNKLRQLDSVVEQERQGRLPGAASMLVSKQQGTERRRGWLQGCLSLGKASGSFCMVEITTHPG
jgi:hypothetical protein